MQWFRRSKETTVEAPELVSVLSPPPLEPKSLTHYQAAALRDQFIIDLIRRFGLLNAALIQRRVALERFGNLNSTHTILTRLALLAEGRQIVRIARTYSGGYVYAIRPRRGRAHVEHDLAIGCIGVSLEMACLQRPDITFNSWCADQSALRAQYKEFAPDARFILNGTLHFVELHTGSQGHEIIIAKLEGAHPLVL